jgi:hypothetical protein
MVEGSSLGKRGGDFSQLRRLCGKTTPFGCPGKERRGEVRGAPQQGYLCCNNQCGGMLPPSLPITQACVAGSLAGGGSTNPFVATMSTMRPGTGDVATTSALGGGAEGERQ